MFKKKVIQTCEIFVFRNNILLSETDWYINKILQNRTEPTNYEAIARNDFCDKSIHVITERHYILVPVTARLSRNLIIIFNSQYENCGWLFRCDATIIIARYNNGSAFFAHASMGRLERSRLKKQNSTL